MSYLMIVGFVVMAGLGALWQIAEAGLDREKKARVTAELQVKQFSDGLRQCRADVAERNRVISGMAGLSDERRRLCAQRGPQSGCCKPDGECKP